MLAYIQGLFIQPFIQLSTLGIAQFAAFACLFLLACVFYLGCDGDLSIFGHHLYSMAVYVLGTGTSVERIVVRTRQQIIKSNQEQLHKQVTYSGLVNTGNTCYMNSVLQALSSAPNMYHFLEGLLARAEDADLDTPVAFALKNTIEALNEQREQHFHFRPRLIEGSLKENPRFRTNDQQDAQELLQMLSTGLTTEEQYILFATRSLLDLPTIRSLAESEPSNNIQSAITFREYSSNLHFSHLSNPLLGLTANRVSCSQCGHTEAIRHFMTDCLPLTLPIASICTLEDCLREYTRMERLSDLICQRCSLQRTLGGIQDQIAQMQQVPKTNKRKKALKRKATILRNALSGNVEEVQGVNIIKVTSPLATKQIMIARPPPTLVIHLSRSMHSFSGYVQRNHCQVRFPEVLDLTPYTTSGELSKNAFEPISSRVPRAQSPKSLKGANGNRNGYAKGHTIGNGIDQCHNDSNGHTNEDLSPSVKYQLQSVVVHLGSSHSYGHYIAYRRNPKRMERGKTNGSTNISKVAYIRGEGYRSNMSWVTSVDWDHSMMDNDETHVSHRSTHLDWLRISDEDVRACSISDVLDANPYLLVYERIV